MTYLTTNSVKNHLFGILELSSPPTMWNIMGEYFLPLLILFCTTCSWVWELLISKWTQNHSDFFKIDNLEKFRQQILRIFAFGDRWKQRSKRRKWLAKEQLMLATKAKENGDKAKPLQSQNNGKSEGWEDESRVWDRQIVAWRTPGADRTTTWKSNERRRMSLGKFGSPKNR